MANKTRLVNSGMPPELAKEVAAQITNSATVALTPLTGAFGTTGNAIVDATATFSQSIMNDNFRRLEDKINAVIAALKA